jgi:hypothetical protein
MRLQNPFGVSVEWLRFSAMNSNGGEKPGPVDPKDVVRMLELELMQKRAARQMAGARWSGLRTASFVFLFVVVAGTMLALYFLFTSGRLQELKARNSPQPSPSTASISPSP